MPTGVKIAATPEQLAGVKYDADGLVPAIAQDVRSKDILMMAWMNADTLRMTLDEGRMVYWSRSRQEVWRKGDTSGDGQYVQEAYYDCDADVLLFLVEQDGKGACHTGEYSCFYRRFGNDWSTRVRIRPDRAEFARQAAEHTMVPVWTELLADLETPVAAYAKLVGDGAGFLLESVEHGERWSRYSFVGRNPVATLELRNGHVRVDGVVPDDLPTDRGILAALDHLIATYRAPLHPDLPPLQGGVMGFLGYDVIREVEHLPDVPHDDRQLPDAVMSIIGSLAAFDHWRQRVYLIESVPTLGLTPEQLDAAYDAAIARVNQAVTDISQPLPYVPVAPPEPGDELPEVRSTMANGMYQQAVEVAKEHIVEGDIFQVVLAQRYDIQLDADPFDFYRVLRQVNPSPYMYFHRHPAITIVGASPEPMVQVLGRKVISRPIAGTRRRGRDEDDDRRMAGELKENPKEVAEHIMLVDLARNDVGRIARFGTVHVDELMTLERYSHVMHLTSEVSGELVDGKTPIDVLRATLPAGTVSGAPKVRAMEIIDELEPAKRGPYAGVVGYVDFSGNLDTAIAIRTMFVGPSGASFQAGAGIVADSIPDDEDLECRNKAAALLAAVPAARRMTAKRTAEGMPA